jgi:hypothetical protein
MDGFDDLIQYIEDGKGTKLNKHQMTKNQLISQTPFSSRLNLSSKKNRNEAKAS